MADKYYILEDEHDGQGWFRPFGEHEFYREECIEYIQGQHYAYLTDVETLGYRGEESDFKYVKVTEFRKGVA